MCRYAMSTYKPHYACFNCRKSFKRRLKGDMTKGNPESVAAKCPQCGELMANMGLDFESPRQSDIKAWQHIQDLHSVGITFHSCGCTGPGYIPNTTDRLVQYLEEILREYHMNLNFWRQRTTPANQKEIDREKSKDWNFIYKIPRELYTGNKVVETEDAMKYWFGRIKEVEVKLERVKIGES